MVDGLIKVDHFQQPHERIQQNGWEIPDIHSWLWNQKNGVLLSGLRPIVSVKQGSGT